MGQGRDRRDRRVVWHYKWERAKRDRRTLNAQIDRAQRVADRAEPLKKQRFVKVTDQKVIRPFRIQSALIRSRSCPE
ncbi:hypothetical protein [Dietzia sp. Die43]|uniref:hypothetical protein n=1 Tax=Dietzia sp. Die43 TaxID=2926011 RepID=UPI0021177AEE|nr:hypothetical protein [Dietzia sp. Die43]